MDECTPFESHRTQSADLFHTDTSLYDNDYWEATRLFELEGYEHNFWCDFQPMTLIMGLIALLVGRIFAIGLQMKEEQELTI